VESVSERPTPQPTFGRWMGSMWLYTILRFALFVVLWVIFYFLGVNGYLSALLAIVLSVPLSYVLLARPRARFTAQIEQRMQAHRHARERLDEQLDPEHHDE
jgi:O-antigen ligase